MSLLSPTMKDVVQSSQSNTSPGLLFPLSTVEVKAPTLISLDAWLRLSDDKRAPIRSVAIVDVMRDRFIAVVIDTVADLPLWRLGERRELMADATASTDPGIPKGLPLLLFLAHMHDRVANASSVTIISQGTRHEGALLQILDEDRPGTSSGPAIPHAIDPGARSDGYK
jgi:hypothetical protein